MNCTNTCPKSLNPAKAIAEIKKTIVSRKVAVAMDALFRGALYGGAVRGTKELDLVLERFFAIRGYTGTGCRHARVSCLRRLLELQDTSPDRMVTVSPGAG